MADINYMNPGSLAPQDGWKPEGFLGGMQWDQQRQNYQQAVDLQQLMGQIGGAEKMEDYTQGGPLREAKRQADLQTALATQQTAVPRAQMTLRELTDKVQRSEGTQKSDIATTIATNASKQGEAGMQQLGQAIKFSQLAGSVMQQGGPAGGSNLQAMAQAHGLDMNNPMVKAIIQSPNSAKQWTDILMQADEKLQGEMAKEKQKTDASYEQAMDVETQRADAQKEVARIGADGRAEAARLKAQQAVQQQGFEKRLAGLVPKISAGTASPQEKMEAEWLNNKITELKSIGIQQQQAVAGTLGMDTPAAVKPTPLPNGQQQAPKYKVGDKISVGGHDVEVTGANPDGTYNVKSKDGRTGKVKL